MRTDLIGIAAMSSNRVIGKDNKLPWHLSVDLKRFKKLTDGHVVIMGRKTYESIGAPLPKRINIVLSSRNIQGVSTLPSVTSLMNVLEAPTFLSRKVFVIGGGSVYAELMPFCNEFHLTVLNEQHDGDTFMPHFEDEFAGYYVEEASPNYEFRHYLRYAPKKFVRTPRLEEHS